jgi:hypothetical protein
MKISSIKNLLAIGDLNLSKHSSRIKMLMQGMNTEFVNSWPKFVIFDICNTDFKYVVYNTEIHNK